MRSTSPSATSSRHDWARPTTCVATDASSCIGSWGRYYDWTKYDLPRGSYGGDIWQIYYRSLDTLDINSLNLTNKPGTRFVEPGRAEQLPRSSRARTSTPPTRISSRCTRTARASEPSISSTPTPRSACTISTTHSGERLRISAELVNGDEVYVIGNPGVGHWRHYTDIGPDQSFRNAESGSQVRRARTDVHRAASRTTGLAA